MCALALKALHFHTFGAPAELRYLYVDSRTCIRRSNVRSDHKVRGYIHGDVDGPSCDHVWVLLPGVSRLAFCSSVPVLIAARSLPSLVLK